MSTLSFTSEREFMQAVIAVAKVGGWLHMHIIDSRKSAGVGFPDLVLVHKTTGRVVYAELKMPKGRVSPEQATWLGALQTGGADAYLWRPADWEAGTIQALLTGERRVAA